MKGQDGPSAPARCNRYGTVPPSPPMKKMGARDTRPRSATACVNPCRTIDPGGSVGGRSHRTDEGPGRDDNGCDEGPGRDDNGCDEGRDDGIGLDDKGSGRDDGG